MKGLDMIWNDPKYQKAIDALGVMEWMENGYNHALSVRRAGIWSLYNGSLDGVWGTSPITDLADFAASCILAEFAEKWLAERGISVSLHVSGKYGVAARNLNGDVVGLNDSGEWSTVKGSGWALYSGRHEALADGMLARLREESAQ